MQRCKNIGICSFYQGGINAFSVVKLEMQDRYCFGDNASDCARYKVKQKLFEGFVLPGDLALDEVGRHLMSMMPDDHARAVSIIDKMV